MNMLGGVQLPKLYVQRGERQVLGGTIRRAVDGTPHTSGVRVIRTWRLRCRPVTYEQFKALETMYEAALGGPVVLRLKEWPSGVFVSVYITYFPDERLLFPYGGNTSARELEIGLEEA